MVLGSSLPVTSDLVEPQGWLDEVDHAENLKG